MNNKELSWEEKKKKLQTEIFLILATTDREPTAGPAVEKLTELVMKEKKALLEKVEELIYEGTDGVHIVVVDRINKEKFNELKELEKGD